MEETQIANVMPRIEHWAKRKKSLSFEWAFTPRYGEPR